MKGVQDALRRLEGVTDIQVDLQTNRVVIVPDPAIELDLAAIPAAIRRAGFTPADMEIVARGTFATRGGESVFLIRGWTREVRALTGDELPGGEVTLRARVEFGGRELVLAPLAR